MSISFNGTGTITGLQPISRGGLPDVVIKAADLNSNQSGTAPIYAARAWCTHNMYGYGDSVRDVPFTGMNVSGITKHAAGDQTVNFSIPMQDANYAVVYVGGRQFANWGVHLQHPSVPKTIYGYRFKTVIHISDVDNDALNVNTVFYR
jgi:hypothetical protein